MFGGFWVGLVFLSVGWFGLCLAFCLVWFDLGLALFVCGFFYVVFLCMCMVGVCVCVCCCLFLNSAWVSFLFHCLDQNLCLHWLQNSEKRWGAAKMP